MPSLDGHSLNEEIKKLREEVFEELAKQREAFSELYGFLAKMEQKGSEPKKTKSKKKTIEKEIANA